MKDRPSPLPRPFARLAALAALVALAAGGASAQPGMDADEPLPGEEVVVSVAAQRAFVSPGGQLAIAVVFDHADGWHIHTHDPVVPPAMAGFTPIPTVVRATAPEWVDVGPIQWPAEHTVKVDFTGSGPVDYRVYEGKAVAYVPIAVAPDAAPGQELAVRVDVQYQACNDRICVFMVEDSFTVRLPVVSLADAAGMDGDAGVDRRLFEQFDVGVFQSVGSWTKSGAGPAKPIRFDVFGRGFEVDPSGPVGLALLLLVAALGGFLLNLTPCVLPVIPLKIMGLSQSAGNPARCFALGAIMSLGVVAFFLAIGGAMAFITGFTAINQLFQTPWFSIGVGAFILVMAIGMLGAFTVSLPKWVYFVNPSHESASGSFLFGVMTAVLSTPCTAPFMGSAAAWAATQDAGITLSTFGAIGAGMALPYLLLAANPKWIAKIPRTGPASELVKQVMGLLLCAVAAFFLGIGLVAVFNRPPEPPSRAYWWVVAAFVVAAGVWLAWRTARITKSPTRRAVFATVGLLLAAPAVAVAAQLTKKGPIEWVYYTPEAFEAARAEGKVIVVDFTAEWCLNCKAMEEGVLHRPEVAKALAAPGVIPMKVDLTGDNRDGKAMLASVGKVGIPLLAVFGPGLEAPFLTDFYTAEQVLGAIESARAPGGGAGNNGPGAAGAGRPSGNAGGNGAGV